MISRLDRTVKQADQEDNASEVRVPGVDQEHSKRFEVVAGGTGSVSNLLVIIGLSFILRWDLFHHSRQDLFNMQARPSRDKHSLIRIKLECILDLLQRSLRLS